MSETSILRRRYLRTAPYYDLLDSPWEKVYQKWRPSLVSGLPGPILEAGVGTGRNLPFHEAGKPVVAFDLSEGMLSRARLRARPETRLVQADALHLPFPDGRFASCLSTFLFCVLPDELQPRALAEMTRVLAPGGRFRLLEILYSRNPLLRARQRLLAPAVHFLYGARFDRRTREWIGATPSLEITSERLLKDDTHLLIEGIRR